MINLNIDYNKYNLLKEKGIIKEINDPKGRKYTFFINMLLSFVIEIHRAEYSPNAVASHFHRTSTH